ncbi:PREDICTED: tyrosine-protein phosphatase non-receptor type 1-like isoform X1 [Priapulus caudatus]|uniref:protein-tyrosine-phosphatase n=1 Tax=Priapulus caudatus TaxID=37621 RepID=A0ABM1F1I8_PRICU|nr:PREDICTED: tyrosine-protein phosphatase non-receptor type 1-like isoform X1 [Priapulus caudatus]
MNLTRSICCRLEQELVDFDKKRLWNTIFQKIQNPVNVGSTNAARKSVNRDKNRYCNISPYDHSRIRLKAGDNDYINASLVEVPIIGRKYILSQGPLSNTAGDFWQMVWEQDCKAIVMLNSVIEKGMPKCHQYWPVGTANGGEDTVTFEKNGFAVEFLQAAGQDTFISRMLQLTNLNTNESREVRHFQYTVWPDFGVPKCPTTFLEFLDAVKKSGALAPHAAPPVIHCSAGIGRSGTFCLVHTCITMLDRTGNIRATDVEKQLLALRRQRMRLIEKVGQLRFCCLVIVLWAKGSDAVSTLQDISLGWGDEEEDGDSGVSSMHTEEEVEEIPQDLHIGDGCKLSEGVSTSGEDGEEEEEEFETEAFEEKEGSNSSSMSEDKQATVAQKRASVNSIEFESPKRLKSESGDI